MIQIIEADFSKGTHGTDYVRLLNDYACDEMGGGSPLSTKVISHLCAEIAKRDSIYVFLAYQDEIAVALITCMFGFSSFQCRPLLNIHDVYVAENFRGQGISTKLLDRAQHLALKHDCCKLTLEVLQGNAIAQASYQHFGFKAYELDPEIGSALFWEKNLTSGDT
ncbi:hypothetical protein MNBD_GAMMA22-2726 [hydrothermal vent metagenome]|uniref:N-acetyltransferase domain-containing protein n=1 Tax=hydrothermal vent metagenome TaxID=652676 RepID=A0A3B0ZIG1_9ZZZZ